MRRLLPVGLALVATACAALEYEPPAPVTLTVVRAPSPVPAGGCSHLVFELGVTNAGTESLVLETVGLTWPEGALALGGDSLVAALRRSDRAAASSAHLPGRSTTPIFFWIATDRPVNGPLDATARVRGWPSREQSVACAAGVEIDATPPLVLGPPVRGGPWHVLAGAGNDTAHRRHVHVSWKQPYLTQRIALDLVRLDAGGHSYRGDPARNASHHAWDAAVLAGTAGTVVRALDGIPDNEGGPRARAVEMLMRTVAGNHVVLDVGDGRFVFYAHLREGSLAVKAGDRVRAGDLLGRLGNSGNSTEPHLHVHVADGPDALAAQGLPFVFDAFTVERVSTHRDPRYGTAGPGPRTGEIPLHGDVLSFR